MESIGEILRRNRERKGLLLRQVGASLEIDQAVISKFERGERKLTRVQVIQFAELYDLPESDLLLAWLSDKLVNELQDETLALKAIQVAEQKIKYQNRKK